MILCGGNSTRFANKLTQKIQGKTLPQRAVEFALSNGATKICVTLNKTDIYTDSYNIRHRILDDLLKITPNIKIAFQNPQVYGTGAALLPWKYELLENFVVLFGDNYYSGKLPEMDKDRCYFTYKEFNNPHPNATRLAYVYNDLIYEKPHGQLTGKFFCGYVHFPRNYWTKYWGSNASERAREKSDRGEIEITNMVNAVPHRVAMELELTGWGDVAYESDLFKLEIGD